MKRNKTIIYTYIYITHANFYLDKPAFSGNRSKVGSVPGKEFSQHQSQKTCRLHPQHRHPPSWSLLSPLSPSSLSPISTGSHAHPGIFTQNSFLRLLISAACREQLLPLLLLKKRSNGERERGIHNTQKQMKTNRTKGRSEISRNVTSRSSCLNRRQ